MPFYQIMINNYQDILILGAIYGALDALGSKQLPTFTKAAF